MKFSEVLCLTIIIFLGGFLLMPVAIWVLMIVAALLFPAVALILAGVIVYGITWVICKIFHLNPPFEIKIESSSSEKKFTKPRQKRK